MNTTAIIAVCVVIGLAMAAIEVILWRADHSSDSEDTSKEQKNDKD